MLAVAGRSGELVVFELIAMSDSFDGHRNWIDAYETGLAHYRAKQFSQAVSAFETADRLRGGDPASVLMIQRAAALQAEPPADDWTGVSVVADK